MAQKNNAKSCKTTWTIRGVNAETRNAVRLAARRTRMTQGEWVDMALMKVASEELKEPSVPALPVEDVLSKIMDRLEVMEQRQTPAPEKPKGFLARLIGQ